MKTKIYRIGCGMTASEVWERYVGSESPGEWLDTLDDVSDHGIALSVASYLRCKPGMDYCAETFEDPYKIAIPLRDILMEYRDSNSKES